MLLTASRRRIVRPALRLTAALIVAVGFGASGLGQDRTLIRVEEDWVALVSQPETPISSPQITNIISPKSSVEGAFGQIQVNHRGKSSFREGGLQVQGWSGTSVVSYANASTTAKLWRSSDNLRYTVAVEVTSTGYKFQLLNGRSRTWGYFASTPVSTSVSASEPKLDDYKTEFSLENSVVNLGAHRIDLFYITAVRKFYSDGTIEEDTTDRVSRRYEVNIASVPLDNYVANPDDYNVEIQEVTQ